MDRPAACGETVPPLKLTEIPIPGASIPVALAFAPNDPTRTMIVQLGGVIRLLKNGALTTFLDLSSVVSTSGDGGLLGFAFHPGYTQNGRFFVFYSSKPDGTAVVQEYKRSDADPDTADPTVVATLITQPHTHFIQYGGMLAFGPDGYLYVSMGDGVINTAGQSLSEKLAKILRIDVDTRLAPPGNMTGPGVDPLIWDWGVRNPWRFSFDRKTGDLYIGDVGEGRYEEIDFEPAGTGHRNYGWATMEGFHCSFTTTCDQTGLILPIIEHPHPTAHAIVGGYVYRGKKIPCLRGRYIYGDYRDQKVWTLTYEQGVLSAQKELTSDLNPTFQISLSPSSFAEDNEGEIHLVTLVGNKMFRIDPE
jgi:glucose/arabinose dehydrogenase